MVMLVAPAVPIPIPIPMPTIIVMLVIFIVFARFSPLHIDPVISLHIVRTAAVLVDIYVGRWRLEITEAETQVGCAYLNGNCRRGIMNAKA
jgi:hypothetical protein